VKGDSKTLLRFLRGEVKLNELEKAVLAFPSRSLLVTMPSPRPGLATIILFSHSCEKVEWWLVTKLLMGATLGEDDKVILTLLFLSSNDEKWSFFREIKDFDFSQQSIADRKALVEKLNELFLFTRGDPTQYWETFTPSFSLNHFWMRKRTIAPKSWIGVGYRDQGSLRGGGLPSLPVEESGQNPWKEMRVFFEVLLHLPLTVGERFRWKRFSRRRQPPPDESQRTKQ